MTYLYLAGLVISLVGMVLIDRRWRLVLWRDARRGVLVLAIGVVFLLVWDAVGVGFGVFFRGDSGLLIGLQLAPEVPIEELFFLTLLCYLTMNLYGALTRGRSDPVRPERTSTEPTSTEPTSTEATGAEVDG